MPADLYYCREEGTALVTPDALRLLLRDAGLPGTIEREGDEIDLVLRDEQIVLMLDVEAGFVEGVELDVTYVDEQARFRRVCDVLESLGWVQADG